MRCWTPTRCYPLWLLVGLCFIIIIIIIVVVVVVCTVGSMKYAYRLCVCARIKMRGCVCDYEPADDEERSQWSKCREMRPGAI